MDQIFRVPGKEKLSELRVERKFFKSSSRIFYFSLFTFHWLPVSSRRTITRT
jgi:hypothetical protein